MSKTVTRRLYRLEERLLPEGPARCWKIVYVSHEDRENGPIIRWPSRRGFDADLHRPGHLGPANYLKMIYLVIGTSLKETLSRTFSEEPMTIMRGRAVADSWTCLKTAVASTGEAPTRAATSP
jgi:hypothetical protein